MPQIASMGASVAVADFDRDGWQDLYVTNSGEGSLNRLYRNKGDGTLQDVAEAARASPTSTSPAPASRWAPSGATTTTTATKICFVYKWGRPELFHNDGGKGFTASPSTPACRMGQRQQRDLARLRPRRPARSFIAGYWPDDVDLWQLKTTRIMPESFEYAKNGGRKYLLRNKGDGTFEDVTAAMGINSRRWTLAVAAADLRGTGYPDLFLANDYGVSELFANARASASSRSAKETGVGRARRRAA